MLQSSGEIPDGAIKITKVAMTHLPLDQAEKQPLRKKHTHPYAFLDHVIRIRLQFHFQLDTLSLVL